MSPIIPVATRSHKERRDKRLIPEIPLLGVGLTLGDRLGGWCSGDWNNGYHVTRIYDCHRTII